MLQLSVPASSVLQNSFSLPASRVLQNSLSLPALPGFLVRYKTISFPPALNGAELKTFLFSSPPWCLNSLLQASKVLHLSLPFLQGVTNLSLSSIFQGVSILSSSPLGFYKLLSPFQPFRVLQSSL